MAVNNGKFYIYARESDADTVKAPPVEEQVKRGKAWGEAEHYELAGVYIDNGYSGGDWKRPEWQRIVRDARARGASVVWTWNQDRLARDTEQFLWFYRNLKERGAKVFSDTEGWIDMETLGGRVKHTTLAMAAEIFRITTSDKVRKTFQFKKQEAKKKGEALRWGRNPIPDSIAQEAQRIHKEQPELGYRSIAKLLPEYKTKTGKVRRASHVWVRQALDAVKKTPTKTTAVPGPQIDGVK